jgi:hypothetical protein
MMNPAWPERIVCGHVAGSRFPGGPFYTHSDGPDSHVARLAIAKGTGHALKYFQLAWPENRRQWLALAIRLDARGCRVLSERTELALLCLDCGEVIGSAGTAARLSVQQRPVPHRRNSLKQRFYHTIVLIQVDLVPAPGRGDVHRVGTQKIQSGSGTITGPLLGVIRPQARSRRRPPEDRQEGVLSHPFPRIHGGILCVTTTSIRDPSLVAPMLPGVVCPTISERAASPKVADRRVHRLCQEGPDVATRVEGTPTVIAPR